MKTVLVAVVALVAFGALIEAFPQPQRIQNLLYRPKPTPPPRPIRVRRQSLGGSVASNPNGGADTKLHLSHGIGQPDHNLVGSVFAAGNTNGGPVTTGGALAYQNGPLGASLTKQHTPGVRDSFTQAISANLFKNDKHSVDANAFMSQNKLLSNGMKFDRNGFGLGYNHADGHGLSVGHSTIPNFGSQLEAAGKANLWSSQDRNTKLDLTGTASKWTSGPFSGKTDFGANVGLTHFFG